MVHLLIALIGFHFHAGALECDTKDTGGGAQSVERINKRYDDFFRYQEHLEERARARNKGRGENKEMLARHEKKMEAARREYIRNRRPRPDTSALEAQADLAAKKRKERLEAARRCYVQQQARAEALLKRGRQIPENKEYDLED